MLKKIQYYYIYKISKFYKEKLKTKEPYKYAVICLFTAVNCIILTLISFVLLALNTSWNRDWIRGITIIVLISGFFLTKSDNYQELAEKYKDEKYSTLKGWLVFLSWIGSFAIWCMVCQLFR